MLGREVFASCSEEHPRHLPDQSTRRLSDPHAAGPEDPLPCTDTLDPIRPRCNPRIVSRRHFPVHKLQFLVHKFRRVDNMPRSAPGGTDERTS